MSWKRLFNKAKGIKLNVAYVFGGTSVFGVSCYIASTNILCDDNSPKKIIKKVIKRDGSDKILNINIKQKDLNEMFDIIFNWFYLWDLLVMKEGDPKENEINYKEFVLSNFDEDWKLTVNGDGFIDKHDLKKRTHDDTEIDWIDFQLSMANDFESSYSNISPLAFIELKYDHKSGNTYVKLRGTALGNMTVKNRKTEVKEMLRTHQRYDLIFIKRQGSPKWKLFFEESFIHVFENNQMYS